MKNENADPALASSRRELQHLWARHALALDTSRRAGDPHVPQIPSIDSRCKLVGLLPPTASEESGGHEAANVVIYIPDNGRDPSAGSEPVG